MKYFIDFEFIEGFRKSLFAKRHHFIDMVSVGIYREDGKWLDLLSSEYNFNDADDWVKNNVISKVYLQNVHGDNRNRYRVDKFHKSYGNTNDEIRLALLKFFGCWRDQHFWRAPEGIEVYGYYADYDWVLLCSLFGRMIDLPKGFPMYCRDLKQMLDEQFMYQERKYTDETRLESWLKFIKAHPEYPKNDQEHNALADAKWNFDLYNFIVQKKFMNRFESGPVQPLTPKLPWEIKT